MRAPRLSSLNANDGLAIALGAVLGFASAAGVALALLLAGRGALVIGLDVHSPSRMVAMLLFLLGAVATALFAKLLRPLLGSGARDSRSADPLPRWMPWLLAAALTLFVGTAIAETIRRPDGGWDAWAIWNARALSLFRTAGDVRLASSPLRDLAGFTAHPEYPLLLPAAIALGWTILGGETPWVPALFSLAPALLIVAIAAITAARRARPRGAWVCAILLTTPMLAQLAHAQYAEMALGALVIAGLALLAIAWDTNDWDTNDWHTNDRRARLLGLSGLALGLAGSVKHEGLLFLAAAALVAAATRPRDLLPMALGAALPLVLFAWFQLGFAPRGDLAQAPIGLQTLRRIGPIAWALARRIVYFQGWGLHLVAFAIALGVRWRTHDLSPAARRLLLVCALAASGFGAAFLTTPHDLEWHLRTSIDRLILQLWPAAVLALSLPAATASRPART